MHSGCPFPSEFEVDGTKYGLIPLDLLNMINEKEIDMNT